MKNQYPARCRNCGEMIPAGSEVNWNRKKGADAAWWHLPACPNGTVGDASDLAEPKSSGSSDMPNGLMQMFADGILPFIEEKLKGKLDGEEVEKIVKAMLQGAIFPKVTTVKIEDVKTGTTRDAGMQHKQFPLLLQCLNARNDDGYRLNILLPGPTGSGKSKAVENAAKQIGTRYGFCGAVDTPYDIIGYKDQHGKPVETQFEDFFCNGGTFCGEELDSWDARAQLAANNALANGWCAFASGMKRRHIDFNFIGNTNTWGYGGDYQYVGRNPLDAAFLSRFPTKIAWDYDEDLERALCSNRQWADHVIEVRGIAMKQGLEVIIDPRKTYDGAALLAAGLSFKTVEEVVLFAGMKAEHLKAIRSKLNA